MLGEHGCKQATKEITKKFNHNEIKHQPPPVEPFAFTTNFKYIRQGKPSNSHEWCHLKKACETSMQKTYNLPKLNGQPGSNPCKIPLQQHLDDTPYFLPLVRGIFQDIAHGRKCFVVDYLRNTDAEIRAIAGFEVPNALPKGERLKCPKY